MTSVETSVPVPRWRRFVGWCALLLLLALVFTASCRDIRNADLGFHLAAGRLIYETGTMPRADEFSHTARGASWHDFEWLYQWATYLAWRAGGAAAVIFQHALLNLLTFGVLAWGLFRRRGFYTWGFVLLLLALLVCELRFSVRPHAAGRLIFAAMLWGLFAYRRDKLVNITPLFLLQVVWANVHGSYFAVLLVTGLLLLDDIFERRRIRRTLTLFLGLVVASWITPYGWSQTWSLLSHQAAVSAGAANPEWLPLTLTGSVLQDPALWAFTALALAVGYRLWRGGGRPPGWFEWAVWLLAVFGPFIHLRALPMSALALVLLAAHAENDSADGRATGVGLPGFALLVAVFLLFETAFVTNAYWAWRGRETRLGLRVSALAPAYGAGRFLSRFNRLGPVFNSYATGGWLIWWLHPRAGWVYIDGRDVGNVYSPEIFAEYLGILLDPSRFEGAANHYGWNGVILERRNELCHSLIAHLEGSEAWRVGYLDDVSVVYLPTEAFSPLQSGARSAPD